MAVLCWHHLISSLWSGFLNTVMETDVCALEGISVCIFFLLLPPILSIVPPDSSNEASPSFSDVIACVGAIH